MRIAMWSGPRNLSTAMMYSFAARADCAISDEPFYAAYLQICGLNHPMRDEILASQPTRPADVVSAITGPVPQNCDIWYQKHMAQHMLAEMPLDWMAGFTNIFLIRHPARVIASYQAKREAPTLADLGFEQQTRLFDHAVSIGQTPVVVDSADIRRAPETTLRALCDAIGLAWDARMLQWPAGPHPDDGIWAAHWYASVHRSTGFAGEEGPLPDLGDGAAECLEAAMPHYDILRGMAIS